MAKCDYLNYEYCLDYLTCDSCKYSIPAGYLKGGGCKLECDGELYCGECSTRNIIEKEDQAYNIVEGK